MEDIRVAAADEAVCRQGSGETELDDWPLSPGNGLMLRTCIGRETPPGAFDATDDDDVNGSVSNSSSSDIPPRLDLNSSEAAVPSGGLGVPASFAVGHVDLSNQRSILIQQVASAQLDSAAFQTVEDDDSTMECEYPDEPPDDDGDDSPEGGIESGSPAATTSESKRSSWGRMPFMDKVSVEWMPRGLSKATAETRATPASSASAPTPKWIAKAVGSNFKAAGSNVKATAQRAMMSTHSAMGKANKVVFSGISNTLAMKPSAEKALQSVNDPE